MYLGPHRRLHYLLVGGLGPAVADVLPDGPGEHEHILLYHADVPAQAALLYIPHVNAVHLHAAGADVVKPGQQLAQGGLAAPGGAHHRQALPRLDVQVDVLQHLHAVAVVKAHVVVVHPAGDILQLYCIRFVFYRGLGLHQLYEAGEAGAAVHVLLGELGQLPYG